MGFFPVFLIWVKKISYHSAFFRLWQPAKFVSDQNQILMKQFFKTFITSASLLASFAAGAQPGKSHEWYRELSGPAPHQNHTADMVAEASGKTILTGTVAVPAGNGVFLRGIYTARVDAAGNQLWEQVYKVPGNFQELSSAVRLHKNAVYTVGHSRRLDASAARIILLKYDLNTGDTVWTRFLTPASGYIEQATDLEIDTSGNLFISGFTYETSGSAVQADYLTLKVDGTTGDTLWRRTYNGTLFANDLAMDVAVDPSGNVIATGRSEGLLGGMSSEYDVLTIKYDPDGNEVWTRRQPGEGVGDDFGMMVIADSVGNVYVSAQTFAVNETVNHMTVIRYRPGGALSWKYHHLGSGLGTAYRQPIALLPEGGVVLAAGTANGMTTIALDSAGTEHWIRHYSRAGLGDEDVPMRIATNAQGEVYVTGKSRVSSTALDDITTLKYDFSGVLRWAATYNGAGNEIDIARAVSLDQSGNIYVAGDVTSADGHYKMALLKYSPDPTVADDIDTDVSPDVFPNPATGPVTVRNGSEPITNLKIRSATGSLVADLAPDAATATFDVSGWPAGIYLLELSSRSGTRFARLAVNH